MVFSIRTALVASMAVATAYAQTSTKCQPLNSTCPADIALGTYTEFDFTTAAGINPQVWNSTSTAIKFGDNGAEFTITGTGDSPTMNTNFYMFFGQVSVFMKAAGGSGICTSITLLSDDLDEIDWEILGSNRTMVESNFFGKGNTTTYDRAIYHELDFAPQDDFHNYTVDMQPTYIAWIVDGIILRNLSIDDPKTIYGKNFPQTPMQLHLGAWAPGDPSENQYTVEWAQGTTDYTKGPYTMYVSHVYMQDGTTGASYTYGDHSGDWTSVKVQNGTSAIIPAIAKPLGVKATWTSMAPGVRIGIIAGSCAGLALIIGAITWCCVKSARKGAREAAIAEAEWAAQQQEAEMWRQKYREERLGSVNSSVKSFGGQYHGNGQYH